MTRCLVVGGGAREHAIAAALGRSGGEVYVAMKARNPGLARLAKRFTLLEETDSRAVAGAAKEWGVELAVVGPEAPLQAGVVDALQAEGVACASPTGAAAEIETSKAFMRALMEKHRLPGGVRHRTFTTPSGLREYVRALHAVAVKPVGLTGGKGVRVTGDQLRSPDDAIAYAEEVLSHRTGGSGVVIEERLEGEEFTLQAFTDGTRVATMPCVQDHKRALEGDKGSNTGGMGSYSDANGLLPFLIAQDRDEATRILQRIVDALRKEGREYRGAIYGQFMLTASGPKVIEVNARLGDPEALNVLALLKADYVEVCRGMADGKLPAQIGFAPLATVCKYVVPRGYGIDGAGADTPLDVDEKAIEEEGAQAYYAAVREEAGSVMMSRSRALGVLATGKTIGEAEQRVERALQHVRGEIRVRHDIATPELLRKRVEHMRSLRAS